MLTTNDLININYIPDESDISLELLLNFYEQHLGKHLYKFTLSNDDVIKLIFSDSSKLFHLIGANHIYDKKNMNGTKFVAEIRSKNITLETMKNYSPKQYKDYIERIRSIFCTDSLLKKCECLSFQKGHIPDSSIGIKYLLLRVFDDINLHLGINTYKEDRPYFPQTMLLTEGGAKDKYIERADEKLSVKKLEIIDIKTDTVIETIDREKAIQLAEQKVIYVADDWIEKELDKLIDEKISLRSINKILKDYLDSHKSEIESEIKSLDPYLFKKIAAQSIRQFAKDQFCNRILSYVDKCYAKDGFSANTTRLQFKKDLLKSIRENQKNDLTVSRSVKSKEFGIDD